MRNSGNSLKAHSAVIFADGLTLPDWLEMSGLTFSDPAEGSSSQCELCAGGAARSVTASNASDFIDKLLDRWFGSGIALQLEAVKCGIQGVLGQSGAKLVNIFSAAELQMILGSDGAAELSRWNEAILRRCLVPGYGLTSGCRLYELLVSELLAMDVDERRDFLVFTCAISTLPPGGLDALPSRIKVDILDVPSDEDVNRACPKASTCFQTLRLPRYTSRESLRKMLRFAMRNSNLIDFT